MSEDNNDIDEDRGDSSETPDYDDFWDVHERNYVERDLESERPQDLIDRATGGHVNFSNERDINLESSGRLSPDSDLNLRSQNQSNINSQKELNFSLVKQTFREASANMGERCTEWLGTDTKLPAHDSMFSSAKEALGAAVDEMGALKDFASNFVKMQVNNFAKSDKYYHCMANCEASSRGAAGQNAARALSCFREASDVVINTLIKGNTLDYTLKDSPTDMGANRTGIEAGRAGVRCSQGCHSYEKTWPEPKYR